MSDQFPAEMCPHIVGGRFWWGWRQGWCWFPHRVARVLGHGWNVVACRVLGHEVSPKDMMTLDTVLVCHHCGHETPLTESWRDALATFHQRILAREFPELDPAT